MLNELPRPSSDGSYQLGPMGPLRLVQSTGDNVRSVASEHFVFEMMGHGDESVVMRKFPDIPETVRFSITDQLAPVGDRPFVRELLYSRSEGRRIMTMTGYRMSARHIEVVSDFVLKRMEIFDGRLKVQIELAKTIELEHVRGFNNAVLRHKKRIDSLKNVTPVDMHEAQEAYEALVYGQEIVGGNSSVNLREF